MAQGMSRSDLIQFIGFLGEKGLMNPQSASGRKAAVSTLLGILAEEEAADVTKLDLNDVTNRFLNLKGSSFKPESVRVYKSRTESAIRDFVSYKQNPLGFKPISEQRAPKNGEPKSKSIAVERAHDKPEVARQTTGFQGGDNIIPIPLRSNLTVRIAGIPPDLTSAEAKKISNVILAFAKTDEV